jgi:hypothetical protein
MKLLRRRFLHLAVGAVGLPAVSRIARAQTYPSRPVRIVVGAAAGGGTDIAVALTASSTAPMPKRIFLVHPYFPAMAPIDAAFKQGWPEAQTVNLLDESLYADVPQDGTLSPLLYGRVATLLNHCVGSGADGIVFTGTTFGPAIEAVRPLKVPLLRVEEAMAEQAVGMGRDILLVCSAKRAMPVIRGSLEAAAQRQNLTPRISELWVSGAKDALAQGGMEAHDRLIAREVEASGHAGTIVIGQISMVGAGAYLSPEIMRRTVTRARSPSARCAVCPTQFGKALHTRMLPSRSSKVWRKCRGPDRGGRLTLCGNADGYRSSAAGASQDENCPHYPECCDAQAASASGQTETIQHVRGGGSFPRKRPFPALSACRSG